MMIKCKECKEIERRYAKGLCPKCYSKLRMRNVRKQEGGRTAEREANTRFRANHRKEYNAYQNKYYHQHNLIIHKLIHKHKERVPYYLCNRTLYARMHKCSRLWKNVTCKACLRLHK